MYGSQITRKSYQEETAIIDSFLQDIDTDLRLTIAINTLKLTEWVAELKTINTTFSEKYIDRVGETAANTGNIPEVRKTTSDAYKNLINHVQAHHTLTGNSAYNTILTEIDVLTKQYNATVDLRSNTTGSGGDSDSSDTDTSTDENAASN